MKNIAVIDSETDPFEYGVFVKPFIWGFFDETGFTHFDSTEKLLWFLKDKEYIVYCHNGGKFDFHFMLEYINKYQEVTVIHGRLAKFTIGLCEFRDSYCILPTPLKEFKKDDFDYSILKENERRKPENRKKILKYLENDCKYLYEYVTGFIEKYGINLTLAGSAFNQWKVLQNINSVPRTTSQFYNRIKPYYFGGRCECFYKGLINKKFIMIDINSAYPYAMLFEHPYTIDGEYYLSENLPTKNIEQTFICLVCKSTGAFPFRETDKSTAFPNDGKERTFYITGWEFITAKELGLLKRYKIKSVIRFYDTINFKKYVNHFYKLKQNTPKDQKEYIYYKLFLNSLYGKFGANPENYKTYEFIDSDVLPEMLKDGYTESGIFENTACVSKPLEENKQFYRSIPVSASITGFVRAYLLRALHTVKNPMYCDTDSIVCTDKGKLSINKELGGWSLDGSFLSGGIAGKKLYAFRKENGEYKTASKGVKATAQEILRIVKGEIITFKKESPVFSLKYGQKFIDKNIKKT